MTPGAAEKINVFLILAAIAAVVAFGLFAALVLDRIYG